MAIAERRAEVVWRGDLEHGRGMVTVGSGALPEFGVTWASRAERPGGLTSPEELVAAAHAACYAMEFSAQLAKNGTPPERLKVDATATLDQTEDGLRITSVVLEVWGSVPDIDFVGFDAIANRAKDGCPVSRALAGSTISLKAYLEDN